MRPKHLYRLREALEANLLLVNVYHVIKKHPKTTKKLQNCQNEAQRASLLPHTPETDTDASYIVGQLMGCPRAAELRICPELYKNLRN